MLTPPSSSGWSGNCSGGRAKVKETGRQGVPDGNIDLGRDRDRRVVQCRELGPATCVRIATALRDFGYTCRVVAAIAGEELG